MRQYEFQTDLGNSQINPLIQCYRRGDPYARERLFAILWQAARVFPLRHGHNGTQEHERFLDVALERLFPALEHYDQEHHGRFESWFGTVLRRIWLTCLRENTFKPGLLSDMDMVRDLSLLPADEGRQGRPNFQKILGVQKWQLLCLRYPELIPEDELVDFAARWAEGRRQQALVRLLEYSRGLAGRRRVRITDLLAKLQFRILRMQRTKREDTPGWRSLIRQKERLLLLLHEDLVSLQYRTLTHLTGLPLGTVASSLHRIRATIARDASSQRQARPAA